MAKKRPTTISEYINAASSAAKPHLKELYALLKEIAPKAEEAIKWGSHFLLSPDFCFLSPPINLMLGSMHPGTHWSHIAKVLKITKLQTWAS